MPDTKKLGTAELLYNSAQRMNLSPTWITPQGLFAVQSGGIEKYINLSRSMLNSHASMSLAQDKLLTHLILTRHNFPNIPFKKPTGFTDAAAFLNEHGRIIVKPRSGSGSRGVHKVSTLAQLQQLDLRGCIVEKYIVGHELRYLVLNGAVVSVHRSEYGTSLRPDRYLERHAILKAEWSPKLAEASVGVSKALGLRFAAVDFLIDANGKHSVLEVNSTPGLKWFHAPTTGPPVDIATLFLQAMLGDEPAPPSGHKLPPRRYPAEIA